MINKTRLLCASSRREKFIIYLAACFGELKQALTRAVHVICLPLSSAMVLLL
jgi:hypothetical protein